MTCDFLMCFKFFANKTFYQIYTEINSFIHTTYLEQKKTLIAIRPDCHNLTLKINNDKVKFTLEISLYLFLLHRFCLNQNLYQNVDRQTSLIYTQELLERSSFKSNPAKFELRKTSTFVCFENIWPVRFYNNKMIYHPEG